MLKKKLRFKATAASASTVLTAKSFADLLCVAATTTSAYAMASHTRLRKIEMWGPMASDLVPVTVTIDWIGSSTSGGFGKSNRVSDTSMGSAEPAHLVARPPPGSQIAEWLQGSSSNNVVQLVFPANTIIDLTYELVMFDDASTSAVTGAVAGATVGANYVRSLDSVTGSNLPPVAYATI